MRVIARYVKALSRFLRRFGVCGNAGLIVGAVVGLLLTNLDLLEGWNLAPAPQELLWIALILTLVGWLLLLAIFVFFVRSRLATVIVPAFVNSLLVSFGTAYLCDRLDLYHVAWLVGMLVGLFIGFVLCSLYKRVLG